MIVEPGLTRHPKFIAFKQKVGPEALEYLVRLWEHCQVSQKGGNWGPVRGKYVECAVGWPKERKGVLFRALLSPFGSPKQGGWIEIDENQNLLVKSWDVVNASLKRSWENGKLGGRPKSVPQNGTPEPVGCDRVNPDGTGQEPSTNLRQSDKRRVEKSRGVVPPNPPAGGLVRVQGGAPGSVDEVIAYGRLCNPVVPEDRCRDFWAHYESQATTGPNGERVWRTSGVNGGAIITNWRLKLPKFGTVFGGEKFKTAAGNGSARPEWAVVKDALAAVEESIAKSIANDEGHYYRPGLKESDPVRWEQARVELKNLKVRRAELKRRQAAGNGGE
jgi:hypothetical protein